MYNSVETATGIIFCVLAVLIILLLVVSWWKIFEKAGRPGWASVIPLYANAMQLEIVKLHPALLVFLFVPYAKYILFCVIHWRLAKAFGKEDVCAWGMVFLPFVFLPIFAFGDDELVKTEEDNAEQNIDNAADMEGNNTNDIAE